MPYWEWAMVGNLLLLREGTWWSCRRHRKRIRHHSWCINQTNSQSYTKNLSRRAPTRQSKRSTVDVLHIKISPDINAASIPLVQATGSRHPPLFIRAVIGVIRVSSSKVWKQHQPTKSGNGEQDNQCRDPISLLDLKVLVLHGFLGAVA